MLADNCDRIGFKNSRKKKYQYIRCMSYAHETEFDKSG